MQAGGPSKRTGADLLTLNSPQERMQKKRGGHASEALYQHARHEIVDGGAVVLWSEV